MVPIPCRYLKFIFHLLKKKWHSCLYSVCDHSNNQSCVNRLSVSLFVLAWTNGALFSSAFGSLRHAYCPWKIICAKSLMPRMKVSAPRGVRVCFCSALSCTVVCYHLKPNSLLEVSWPTPMICLLGCKYLQMLANGLIVTSNRDRFVCFLFRALLSVKATLLKVPWGRGKGSRFTSGSPLGVSANGGKSLLWDPSSDLGWVLAFEFCLLHPEALLKSEPTQFNLIKKGVHAKC